MAKTIAQIQALITGKGDAREIINEIADYLQANPPSPGGSSSYLVYTPFFAQSGTDAPVVTELENTLGGTVVWTRDAAGNYKGTLAGAFPATKTYIAPFGDWGGAANTYIPIWDAGGTTILGYMTMFRESDNVIGLQINDNAGTLVDYSTLFGATKISLPEIRVYP